MKSKFLYTKNSLTEYALILVLFTIITVAGIITSEPILMYIGGLLLILTSYITFILMYIRSTQREQIITTINKNIQAPKNQGELTDEGTRTPNRNAEDNGSDYPVHSEATEGVEFRSKT